MSQSQPSRVLLVIALVLWPVLFSAVAVKAEPFAIEIDSYAAAKPGDTVYIPVKKIGGDLPLAAFEFMIGFDTTYLRLVNVRLGDIYYHQIIGPTQYWNYVDISYGPFDGCNENCPDQLFKFDGYPYYDGVNPGAQYDHYVDDGLSLFYIAVEIKDNITEEASVPIRFQWLDCYSNIIFTEDSAGQYLSISDSVIDYDGTLINDPGAVFPTNQGAPATCLDTTGFLRHTNFQNGFINIVNVDVPEFAFGIELNRYPTPDLHHGDQFNLTTWKLSGDGFLSGFDFLIGYEAEVLIFLSATPGEIFDESGDYAWEYFTYRLGPFANCGNGCPSGLIRFVGVAEINDGIPHPRAQYIEDSTSLFDMNFQVTMNQDIHCIFTPIEFYWIDCGDNAVAFGDPNGDSLGLANGIYYYEHENDYHPVVYGNTDMPTRMGPHYSCFETVDPLPIVDFYNGSAAIICNDAIDDRGDVNLNGIAYEIADLIVFTNYFLQGLSAFIVNPDDQILTTDILTDNQYLQLTDLIYLTGVVIGHFLPFPEPNKDPFDTINGTIELIDTDSSIIVTSQFEDSVGAIHFCFYAPDQQDITFEDFTLGPALDSAMFGLNTHDDSIKILLTRNDWSGMVGLMGLVGSDSVILFEFNYTGQKPMLSYASAAGKLAEYVDLSFTGIPDNPPVFDSAPSSLTNEFNGSFRYDFNADDYDMYADQIQYEIINGPGQIDSETGEFIYAPICEDAGGSYMLELCASDFQYTCPQSDSSLHLEVELNMVNDPPALGDVNDNGTVDLLDVVYLIDYVLGNGPDPQPVLEMGEVNNTPGINIFDITHLIDFLYQSGPPPVCP